MNTRGPPDSVTAKDPGYWDRSPTQALVYADGSIWVLGAGERLVRIDATTGKVVRLYTYRSYDPTRAGGLDFLTAGDGWLWFLDNGYPFSGVLRVSEVTGRPAGGVSIAPNSCGAQSCSQIYFTPGSIWVPNAKLLIQIDPSSLPGRPGPFAVGAGPPPMIILKSLRLGSGEGARCGEGARGEAQSCCSG